MHIFVIYYCIQNPEIIPHCFLCAHQQQDLHLLFMVIGQLLHTREILYRLGRPVANDDYSLTFVYLDYTLLTSVGEKENVWRKGRMSMNTSTDAFIS